MQPRSLWSYACKCALQTTRPPPGRRRTHALHLLTTHLANHRHLVQVAAMPLPGSSLSPSHPLTCFHLGNSSQRLNQCSVIQLSVPPSTDSPWNPSRTPHSTPPSDAQPWRHEFAVGAKHAISARACTGSRWARWRWRRARFVVVAACILPVIIVTE